MSPRPIAHSDDLSRLRDEGYTLRLVGGRLVVDDIPYVDSDAEVHHDGALVMPLTLAGEQTTPPDDHTAYFIGGVPCTQQGTPLEWIINNKERTDLGDGLIASCYFSAKPTDGGKYSDYHHKVTAYVGHIAGPARVVDETSTPRRFRPVAAVDASDGPFKYLDTASSRAGIDALNEKLASERVGVIGLGGSGEYILDLVAKTRVAELHLFDGDPFLTHNAFRSPGAPTLEELNARPLKVEHFAALYSNMRDGIFAHPYRVDDTNVHELRDLTFVFVAIDDAAAKVPIITALLTYGIPFVDVGMGIEVIDGRLTGIVRTTMVTPDKKDHVGRRIPTITTGVGDDYRSNIQIPELNAMNAVQAVLLWKKYRQIYADADTQHHTMYSVATNRIVNEECAVGEAEDTRSEEAA